MEGRMYHQFKDEDGNEFGSFETFYKEQNDGEGKRGWYWWACFPGCLPDGEPTGPFKSEDEAIRDAQGLTFGGG